MSEQTVEVIYFPNGVKEVQLEGVPGTECHDITRAITAANEVLETEETEEACQVMERPAYLEGHQG